MKTSLFRTVRLIQAQLQPHLDAERVVIVNDSSFTEVEFDKESGAGYAPAIAIVKASSFVPIELPAETLLSSLVDISAVQWFIDFSQGELAAARKQVCARAAITEYWQLSLDTCELRTYSNLRAGEYQNSQLLQSGALASPISFPQLNLKLQEPVPLYFLTRTLNGQRVHISNMLPLCACSSLS